MAKPILIIRLNQQYGDSFTKVTKSVRAQFNNEYHILLIGEHDLENPTFEVFNVDKEAPISYAQLKKLINKEVELKVID